MQFQRRRSQRRQKTIFSFISSFFLRIFKGQVDNEEVGTEGKEADKKWRRRKRWGRGGGGGGKKAYFTSIFPGFFLLSPKGKDCNAAPKAQRRRRRRKEEEEGRHQMLPFFFRFSLSQKKKYHYHIQLLNIMQLWLKFNKAIFASFVALFFRKRHLFMNQKHSRGFLISFSYHTIWNKNLQFGGGYWLDLDRCLPKDDDDDDDDDDALAIFYSWFYSG